jgi:hypothetical protein
VAQHPLCQDCLEEGTITAERIEVDHVIPIHVRPDLRLAPRLRSRCAGHHRVKTMQDRRLYGAG